MMFSSLWLLISILQFWPPAACGGELHPLRRLGERRCSPGGLTPLPDSWRVPHNGSGGQLFLWELASAEKKLHTCVVAWVGEEADALVEN